MRQDFTRIAVILDRSGSMSTMQAATISGFNEFVAQQKALPGYATLKLVQFDDQYEVAFDKPLAAVPELTNETFVPRGMTALNDAIGRTVEALGQELARKYERDRPARVLVVIITDGGENASKEFNRPRVAEMVKHQQDKYSWNFVFIGANQDAVLTARSFNIARQAALTYNQCDPLAVNNMTRSLTSYTTAYRSGTAVADCGFSDEDRKKAMVGGSDTGGKTTGTTSSSS